MNKAAIKAEITRLEQYIDRHERGIASISAKIKRLKSQL